MNCEGPPGALQQGKKQIATAPEPHSLCVFSQPSSIFNSAQKDDLGAERLHRGTRDE
jgi:hypothetical protein